MKKIVSILLSAVILFSFAACGKEKAESSTPSVDLEYYAKLGSIPDCPYKLGQDIEELKSALETAEKETVEAGGDYVYQVTEGELSVQINNGSYIYYYEKDKEVAGISYIAALDSAFGFDSGESILSVKDALAGIEYTEEDATSDNVFFMLGFSGGKLLKYTFDNITIIFVFSDSMLTAAAIYDTDNWTI